MKKILLLIIVCISCHRVWAQEEEFKTLFQHKSHEKIFISGFGGPIMSFTTINKEFAVLMGGGGAMIVGNFFFGGYGMGLVNELQYKNETTESGYLLNFGHGGLWSGYTFKPRRAIHATISGQMGWGSVAKALKTPDGGREPGKNYPIFVLTPIAQIEFNFSRFFRLGAGVSYSFVSGKGITQTNYTSQDFGVPAIHLLLSFGWFD